MPNDVNITSWDVNLLNGTIGLDGFEHNDSSGNVTADNLFDYQSHASPPIEELLPVSIVYGLTLVLGVVGNILVIFSVTRYQQMVTTTNTFLLSLASADLLLVLICVPVKVSFSCMLIGNKTQY
jgi:hypothetical protein